VFCVFCFQDVSVIYCSPEFYHKTKVLATARMSLKQQGIVGLNQAPCLRALLTSLPVILQQQHTCEKVREATCEKVVLTSRHSDAQGWASECPDVKTYKWWLNPFWHRMLYSCTHMITVGIKGLKTMLIFDSEAEGSSSATLHFTGSVWVIVYFPSNQSISQFIRIAADNAGELQTIKREK